MTSPELSSSSGAPQMSQPTADEAPALRHRIEACLGNVIAAATQSEQRAIPSPADLNAICVAAKAQGIRAEHLVILVKDVWNHVVLDRWVGPRSPTLNSLLSSIVTATLNCYYDEKTLDD